MPPEAPTRELAREDAESVPVLGVDDDRALHLREQTLGEEASGKQSGEEARNGMGVGDEGAGRPRDIGILSFVVEVLHPPCSWQLRSLERERIEDAPLELVPVRISSGLLDDEAERDVVGV